MAKDTAKLDYTGIRLEFEKHGVSFPLEEVDCVGLTDEERALINPCGTYCGGCEDYGVVCDGCRNRRGRPLWYDMFGRTDICSFYTCCAEKGISDCSQCSALPCKRYAVYPDPSMNDDIKQFWFDMRMRNFSALPGMPRLEIKASFAENERELKDIL